MPADVDDRDDAEEPSLPRLGDVLAGKYRIERELGRGGMGVVYLAQHELLHQPVAIKLLLPHIADSEEAVTRFLNEARAAARLRNEHVAAVMDVGRLDDGSAYMVLEYLEGEDLSQLLEAQGPLPIALTVDFILQALEAVAQAHKLGIIHRDLKPANLFVAKKLDGTKTVKVLDFGISKAVQPEGESGLTLTKAVLGSPGYMSPEQVRNSRNVDARTDVWAMGVILYRLLTDTAPFVGDGVGAVFAAILEDTPVPVCSLRPEIPVELEAAIARCLLRDREARFANVGELAIAIAPFASAEGAASVERITRTLGTSGRISQPSTSGMQNVVAAAATAASAAAAAPTVSRPRLSEVDVAEPPKKKSRALLYGVAGAFVVAAGLGTFAITRKAPPVSGSTSSATASSSASAATSASASVSAMASASAAPSATGVMDAPRPESKAKEDYEAALRWMRDGFLATALSGLQTVVGMDKWHAAAHLHRALLTAESDPDAARVSYRSATAARDHLSPRDTRLFEATRHYVESPPSVEEWEKALNRIHQEMPLDAEVAFWLGRARALRGDTTGAKNAFSTAVKNDPKFGYALYWKAEQELEEGDIDEARRSVDRCLDIGLGSASCLRMRIRLRQQRGDCAGIADDARLWKSRTPDTQEPFQYIAESEFATRKANFRAFMDLVKARASDGGTTELFWQRQASLLEGKFAAAVTALESHQKLAQKSPSAGVRAQTAVAFVRLRQEMGEVVPASDVARAYLDTKGTASRGPLGPEESIASDATPEMLAAMMRGHALTPVEMEKRRGEWLTEQKAYVSQHVVAPAVARAKGYVWLYGHALTVATPEEARRALDALPEYGTLPPVRGFEADVALARTYVLAKMNKEAIAILKPLTSSCGTLHRVVADTQAWELLGEAHEGAGNTAEACKAYDTVLERWKDSAHSVTAEAAKKRRRTLTCP